MENISVTTLEEGRGKRENNGMEEISKHYSHVPRYRTRADTTTHVTHCLYVYVGEHVTKMS